VALTDGTRGLAPDPPSGARGGGSGAVLVLRALGLGDALAGIPALRGVRRAWPGRRVLLAAPPAVGAWLEGLGLVDGVVPTHGLGADGARDGDAGTDGLVGAPAGGHVAVNLHGSGPESHRALLATRPDVLVAFASAPAGVDGPAWDPAEHEVDRWCRLVSAAGGACSREDLRLDGGPRGRHVVVHPGAAAPSRRWPAERFAAVVRHLAGAGHDVVVTGGPAETGLCGAVAAGAVATASGGPGGPTGPTGGSVADASGTLDLPALADLVATARLVVCGDTGVAHLATAYGTPSVVLFGPTSPTAWGPAVDVERHTVLWHGDGTAGGAYRGDPHGTVLDPALARVTVDEVVGAADALLDRVGQRP